MAGRRFRRRWRQHVGAGTVAVVAVLNPNARPADGAVMAEGSGEGGEEKEVVMEDGRARREKKQGRGGRR